MDGNVFIVKTILKLICGYSFTHAKVYFCYILSTLKMKGMLQLHPGFAVGFHYQPCSSCLDTHILEYNVS